MTPRTDRWSTASVVAGVAVLLLAAAFAQGLRKVLAQQAGSGQPQGSAVFTPAHRSLGDAFRDFFGRRAEPVQPVAFTHRVHLAIPLECAFCHAGVDQGPEARIPGTAVCMTCHQTVAREKPEIRKVAAYQARGEDIPWQRVYVYSRAAHVRFHHAAHVRAGVNCSTCHGDLRTQTVAVKFVDLTMGFCVNCHKLKKASIDCTACHF